MCEKKHDQLRYNGRERGRPFILFDSTVTPLHDANDHNEGCMHGTDLSLFTNLSVFKTCNERASGKARMEVGSSGLSFAFLSCAGYQRALYSAVARSARLCYSDERYCL